MTFEAVYALLVTSWLILYFIINTHNFKSLILMQPTIIGTYDDCRYFEIVYVLLSNKSGKFITKMFMHNFKPSISSIPIWDKGRFYALYIRLTLIV